MDTRCRLLLTAWKKLILAYLSSLVVGLAVGTLMVMLGVVQPAQLFEASTKRLSYALPLFELGSRHGIDMGILLFVWNSLAALLTLSFAFTGTLFDPARIDSPPRAVRKLFCGSRPMKLLCRLPGCRKIQPESLRRLYVWLMVPLLGMVLLGIESGLQVSTAADLFGSHVVAVIALLPHGVIEIPVLALAGAVAYSAHLKIKKPAQANRMRTVFRQLKHHCGSLPMRKIIGWVIGGLLVAGLIEAHVTQRIVNSL